MLRDVCVCVCVCLCAVAGAGCHKSPDPAVSRHDSALGSFLVNSKAQDGSPLSSSLPKQGRHFQTGACVRERSHEAKVCRSFHRTELRALSAPKSDVPMSTSPAKPGPDSTRKLKAMASQSHKK